MEVKLACGADMNRVWEGATQPLTEHEAECPACQAVRIEACLLYTSPSPRDLSTSRMPSSA